MEIQNLKYIKEIDHVDLFNAGYVTLFDFNNSNSSQEAREEACAFISQVCYNKTIANPKKHFERLLTENGDRASEVLGFIPFIDYYSHSRIEVEDNFNNYFRFGYIDKNNFYTNVRNVYNFSNLLDNSYNDEYENFVVIKIKIPYMIVDHFRRHGMLNHMFSENWQSNRRKHEIEYFKNDEIEEYNSWELLCREANILGEELPLMPKIRTELINKGEFGLRYVTGFIGGWLDDPMTWGNLFAVRSSNNTQKEAKELVNVMKSLINKHYDTCF